MLKPGKVFLRAKLYFLSDIRRYKRHYVLGVLSAIIGIALAIIFVVNNEIKDLEYVDVISDLMLNRSLFSTFFCFLPSIIVLILALTLFSLIKRLKFLTYLFIILWIRKLYLWGIWGIFSCGINGIFCFLIYFVFLLWLLLISELFICRCVSESCFENPCSRFSKEARRDLLRECIILQGIVILIQLICHVLISAVLVILF